MTDLPLHGGTAASTARGWMALPGRLSRPLPFASIHSAQDRWNVS